MPHKKLKKRRRGPTKGAEPEAHPPRANQVGASPDPDDEELVKPLEGAIGDALKKRDP